MQLERADLFYAEAGWQRLSFLRLTASDGSVGWSEFHEGFAAGLGGVVRALAHSVLGSDPREIAGLTAVLRARGRAVAGGLHTWASAAIENACLDLKARHFKVPVVELLGGAVRRAFPTYWSHCGLYRIRRPDLFEPRGMIVPRSMADMARLAAEVGARGHAALKTNLLSFTASGAGQAWMPGFARSAGYPALHVDAGVVRAAVELVAALKAGAPEVGRMIDLNHNCKPEGARRIAEAIGGELEWLEIDGVDPDSLAWLRSHSHAPIASLEAIYGRQAMLPYLQARAVDVAIIDPMWNGLTEALRMAVLADTFDVNVASHLYSGELAKAMCAHLCAAIPNLRIMELDVDTAEGSEALCIGKVPVVAGEAHLPDGPGWGVVPDASQLVHAAGVDRGPAQ